MTGELFYWVLNMSLIASLMGMIILAVRKIKIIPRRFSVCLWIVPFIRMCFPIGLDSPYSLMSLISRVTTKKVPVYVSSEDLSFSLTNTIMEANSYFPIEYKADKLDMIFKAASFVWITVMLGIMITLFTVYISTMREVKKSSVRNGNIYLSDKVTSPAVYGIIKPRIVFPSSFADEIDNFMIDHETTHIKRGDNFWRILAFFTAAVHWFNPLSWLFLKKFLEDIELACDEQVISKYDDEEKKQYALKILSNADNKNYFASAFGGANVRTRIEKILSFKKIAWFSAAVIALFVIAVIYVLITNAA